MKEKVELDAKMNQLHVTLERAEELREIYRHNLRKTNIPSHKAVAVTDFTAGSLCEYGTGGTFEIYTMAICTSKLLDLGSLASLRPAEKPQEFLPFDTKAPVVPPSQKRKRRTKLEIEMSEDKPVKNSESLRVQLQATRKVRKIPFTSEPTTSDTPHILYFDFVCEKRDHVGQNDVYVRRSTEILAESGLFKANGITELEWFSDGCGKVTTYIHLCPSTLTS